MKYSSRIVSFLQLTRPYNVIAQWLAFVIGVLLAGGSFGISGLVGVVVLALIHSAGTLQNDVIDFEIDKSNKVRTALQTKQIALGAVHHVAVGLYGLAFLISFYAPQKDMHLLFAAALFGLGWLYNMPPLLLSRRPVVSITTLGLFYSAIPLAYGYKLAGGSWWAVVGFGVAWFMIRSSISILKDYKDIAGDKHHGKATFLLRFGDKVTAWTSLGLALCGYTVALCLLVIHVKNSNAVFGFVVGLIVVWEIRLRIDLFSATSRRAQHVFRQAFITNHIFELGVIAWLLIS